MKACMQLSKVSSKTWNRISGTSGKFGTSGIFINQIFMDLFFNFIILGAYLLINNRNFKYISLVQSGALAQ